MRDVMGCHTRTFHESMIQGARVRLHRGTVCYILAGDAPLDGERCTVLSYDSSASKWRVRMQGAAWGGRELHLPETALRLSFSLLPSSPGKLQCHFQVESEGEQGACGRGLVAAQRVPAGMMILEEPPLIVAFKSTSSLQEHHYERWLAYGTLRANARMSGASNHAALVRAFDAFDSLGVAAAVPSHVREGAAHIVAMALEAGGQASSISEEQREAHLQHVTAVLMRFQSNQFTFNNGAPAQDPSFYAAAVYAFISRINHSCRPSCGMVSKSLYCSANRIAFNVEEEGSAMCAYALRDLAAGDRITFNYGPDELVKSWGLHERRAFLRERLNFVCGCERCIAEEAEEARTEAATVGVEAAAEEREVAAEEADSTDVEAEVEGGKGKDGAMDAEDGDGCVSREAPVPTEAKAAASRAAASGVLVVAACVAFGALMLVAVATQQRARHTPLLPKARGR